MNRTVELARLMESLLSQQFKDFEILLIDQNPDDRIEPVLERYRSQLDIRRTTTPTRRGISSGRNDGWRRARGDIIVFPDDDAWYPPWFLRKGVELLDETKAELVSGRFADENGRSINARVASRANFITRRTVWIAQSEAATFYRRELLERVGGFDEGLGIGSPTPWQAAEGPDLILKALKQRCLCYYDPSLYAFHREYDFDDPGMVRRGRIYGRGMGYVLRRHRFGVLSLLYWLSRPLTSGSVAAIKGQSYRASYSLSVLLGRFEGWTGRLWVLPSETINYARIGSGPASYGRRRREMTGPYRARNPLLVGALYVADGIAALVPKRSAAIAEDRPLRVLVANWGHLGDVVAILPLIKFLECNPRVRELGILIGSQSRAALESSDITARIHVIDHWALDRRNMSILRNVLQYYIRRASLIRELRQCKYDISIDTFATFPSSHGITWSASIPSRVGFRSSGLGRCLTFPLDWIPDRRRMLDHQLELLRPLLGRSTPKSLAASYPGFKRAKIEHQLDCSERPYLVIHMGPESPRAWVPQKWAVLAAALKAQGYDLVATGGRGEDMEAARLLNERVPIRNVTGRQSWQEFVSTIAGAAGVVTVDTVTGHVAACFGVPTVVLTAGRQSLDLWRPNQSRVIALMHQVACAPCNRTRGCSAMACVRLIEVGDALSSLQRVMKSQRDGISGASEAVPITRLCSE